MFSSDEDEDDGTVGSAAGAAGRSGAGSSRDSDNRAGKVRGLSLWPLPARPGLWTRSHAVHCRERNHLAY